MKKAGIILASVLGVLLLAAWIIPTFYKDKILARVQREINNRVAADVQFSPENVNISLLRHFPNLSIQTGSLSIAGKAPFVGDTLLSAADLDVSLNLMSVLGGDKLEVKGVHLDRPRILIKRLRNGQANYDIYKPVESTEPQADTTKAAVTVNVEEWSIENGFVRYEDLSLPMKVRLENVQHTGSGSLSADISDLALKTRADRMTVTYANTEYLTDKKLDADMRLHLDLPQAIYTFTDNRITLNDLPLQLAGTVAMPDTNIRLDLTYKADDNSFKNLLSLVPGIYSEQFKDIDADGTVRFDGNVKGIYNARQFPAFVLNMLVQNGRFKYPDLPSSVENIALDVTVSNATDRLDNTVINLKKLAANLGNNPVRGRALVQGLTRSTVDADITAKLNLGELTQLFPIDSLTLRGLYDLNLKAKGLYDKTAGRFPVVNAAMKLQNGYVKSLKFPEPLENVNAVATVTNRTGRIPDTRIDIGDLRLRLAGEPFEVRGWVQNLNDYTYDLAAKGKLDLTKVTRIFPIEGTRLAGLIDADIRTSGKVSDAKAGRYDRLPASGTLAVTNLVYKGDALPQGLTLNSARFDLKPGQLAVPQMRGLLGSSAFTATGSLSNYIPFLLEENEPLRGNLTVKADKFNLNEWMTDSPTSSTATASRSIIEVPANIDFTLKADVDHAQYEAMHLDDLSGTVLVANKAVRMQNVTFNSLGGKFVTNGLYSTTDITKPGFAFDLSIQNAKLQEAFEHLTVVKALMPLAQYMFGDFTSKFQLNGLLGQDMMPQLSSLTGEGIVKVLEAQLRNNPIVDRIIERTKLNELKDSRFKDLLLEAEIDDGHVGFKPFDIKVKDYVINVSGSNGLDGSLNYILKLDVPTGRAGTAFSNAFASLTKQALPAAVDRAKIDLALGGTFKTPQVRFLASSTANQLAQQVAKPLIDEAKQRVQGEVRSRVDSLQARGEQKRAEAEARARVAADSVKAELARRRLEAEQKAKAQLRQEGAKFLDRLRKPVRKDTT
ncbi:AsmA-like C-terminal region-containing protein [Tellurirhabdus rosea]|uniref:AsmA-like C-terminal region-containing protein n=1 Tax=Tellurirhabdus rosea TaxID=2674997 RepID=UPI0022593DBF|nr:AsmA-like C-terminal region-containing protein [Tellurirhabdus rosea]